MARAAAAAARAGAGRRRGRGCRTARLLLEDVDLDGPARANRSSLRVPRAAARPRCFACSPACGRSAGAASALPQDARILFLPQKPYLPIGTLREALSYPETPERYSDEACREALDACGLGHLAARLDETANWSLVLSGGEQQRLAFARALLYRPDWLFLDEATSALDEAAERRMYELLSERLPAAAVISVAHRQSVARSTRGSSSSIRRAVACEASP